MFIIGQLMSNKILPKNKRNALRIQKKKRTQDTILSAFRLFFGRSYGSTILFRDLLTFSKHCKNTNLVYNAPRHIKLVHAAPEALSKNSLMG